MGNSKPSSIVIYVLSRCVARYHLAQRSYSTYGPVIHERADQKTEVAIDKSYIKELRQFYCELSHAVKLTLPKWQTNGSPPEHLAQIS